MTKQETLQAITKLKVYYPNNTLKDLNKQELDMMITSWHEQLERFDVESVSKAIKSISTKSKWFPSLAELLSEVVSLQNPELKRETAESQWEIVLQAIRKHGDNKKEAYKMFNPRTQSIMDKMDFYILSEMLSSELSFKRNTFIAMYNDDTEIITEDMKIGIGLNELLKLNPMGDEDV